MILNLGCGNKTMDGAVNVDVRAGGVRADARMLPFRDGVFGLVCAFDIFEHFTRDGFMGVMAELRRVCIDGAKLEARVPNLTALASCLLSCPDQNDGYVRNIYGGHRWGPDGAWDTHHWGWTPVTFAKDLALSGWAVVSNDEGLNMNVEAVLEGVAA